ncbi:MAG: hypothetical protein ACI9VR_005234 [Cognaticolwellia sp.]|jgi:hypothetical protein
MFKKVALASTLLALCGLAIPTASQVFDQGGLSAAQAADFTGRVKNIRIKKKRVGSGFKISVKSQGEDADSVASAQISIADSDGLVLEEMTLDTAVRGRVLSSGTLDISGMSAESTLTFSMIDNNGDPFGEQQEFEVSVDGLEARTAEGGNDDGWKVRAKVNAETGALSVVLMNEDKSWDGSGDYTITATLDSGTPVSLSIDEVRQKWTQTADTDLSAYESVVVDTVLYDADGVVLDSQSETVTLVENTTTPELSKMTLKENKKGNAKLATWTISDGSASALEVDLVDNATGESVMMTVDDTPVRTQQALVYEGLEFDGEESAEGYIYLCLIDLIDEAGDPVGEQYEVELTTPSFNEDGSNNTAYVTFADGQGAISMVTNSNGIHAHVAWEGEDVSGANIIFEEPYEGPAPLETELNAELLLQFDRWVQVADAGLPANYSLTTTLTTSEGSELDSFMASGSGSGKINGVDKSEKYGDILIDGVPLEFD